MGYYQKGMRRLLPGSDHISRVPNSSLPYRIQAYPYNNSIALAQCSLNVDGAPVLSFDTSIPFEITRLPMLIRSARGERFPMIGAFCCQEVSDAAPQRQYK